MSLSDPTIRDTTTVRRSGLGMAIWCAIIFGLALIGGWAMASMTGVNVGLDGFDKMVFVREIHRRTEFF